MQSVVLRLLHGPRAVATRNNQHVITGSVDRKNLPFMGIRESLCNLRTTTSLIKLRVLSQYAIDKRGFYLPLHMILWKEKFD